MITRYVTGIYCTHSSTLSNKKDLAKKMNSTMVGPFAGSSGMAAVFKAAPSRQPLCDGLVDSTVERFF
jgi:hypothetical protein